MRGRAFTQGDGFAAPRIAVVNEALVRERFGGRDPMGRSSRPTIPGEDDRPLTIVGVIGDARYNSLRETDPAR